jgi:hypothetical protein
MKQIILVVILLAATGGALYYLLQNKKTNEVQQTTFQQMLNGEWKIDSVALSKKDSGNVIALMALALDSNFLKYTYDFKENGGIVKKLGDSTLVDQLSYKMKDSATIILSETGSTDEVFELKLISTNKNRFALMDKDSTNYYFIK